ncbi:MAG TPA: hypothetical protein VFS83_20080 [Ktedonobacterales bacterium]|nr:hypothetical protein [Ktedonobacterales bacterium]
MGARANYVLIEDGALSIYYFHWGAMSVPAVVIDGPDATIAYIREQGSDAGLMDDNWAEGGILLDVDRRALLFFGGENIIFSPPWQRIFLRMMRRVWQGWSIAWAGREILDIASYPGVAEFLGIDPSSLIMRDAPITDQPYTGAKILAPHENPWVYTVITVTWEDGRVGDYTFDSALDGYLLFGPSLLDILREREPDALPCEEGNGKIVYYDAPDQAPREGAYIDTETRAMWIMHHTPVYSAKLERIEQIWPRWSVNEHCEGLGRQVALSGRSPALVAAPYAQVAHELIGDLMAGHNDNDDYISRLIAQALAGQPSEQSIMDNEIVHPTPLPPLLPAEERRAHLTALLQQALQEDASDRASE